MTNMDKPSRLNIVVIGGGPAGLMAAERLALNGAVDAGININIDVYDAMPSLARKFLLAGKGGLNLTHSEPHEDFLKRYGARETQLAPMLEAFGPQALRDWASDLGITTFVGSSGRVFPQEMKAAPLLRAWLHRLRGSGVRIHARHRWLGWQDDGSMHFATPQGMLVTHPDAVILALGGGSWSRLGSDGAWMDALAGQGITVVPLRPANCGFDVVGRGVSSGWSRHFVDRYAGQPVKPIMAWLESDEKEHERKRGELVVTETGVEGGLVYALSARLRDALSTQGAHQGVGSVRLMLDLLPDHDLSQVITETTRPRGARSLASHLQSRLGLKGVKVGLLRELLAPEVFADTRRLADSIKALPLPLAATRPLEEAISSAGGVDFAELDTQLMLKKMPGVFCAGEMLDWEAPTGGYLLTACFASGYVAGDGAFAWLRARACGL